VVELGKDRRVKYFFIFPSVTYALLMVFSPILYTLALSFCKWSMAGPVRIVFFENYTKMFVTERFINAVLRTIIFSAGALSLEMALGTAIALVLNRNVVGKIVVQTLFLLPMVATPVSIGMVWMLIYEPSFGILNALLQNLGMVNLPIWLGDSKTALLSIAIIDIWQWTPMIALIVLAGLSSLPKEPFESARVDGAKSWQSLFHITMPMVMPTIVVAGLLRLIDVLKTFDIIFATTQGGPMFGSETLNIYSYVNAFQYFDIGYASALLIVFFVFVMTISVFYSKLRDKVSLEL
jgi:multiple sugar transport system permease protein